MAEEKDTGENASSNDDALLATISEIEKQIEENEGLRNRLRYYSLGGLVIILAILGLFLMRLVNYAKTYDTETLTEQLTAETTETLQSQAQETMQMVQDKEIMEDFTEKLQKSFEKKSPEFKAEMNRILDNVQGNTVKHLEKRLVAVMSESLAECETELKEVFPEFDPVHLNKYLEESSDVFIEKLHEVIEERIAQVEPHLAGIKNTASLIRDKDGKKVQVPDPNVNIDVVKQKLLEAVIDLLIYELKPELGKEPAETAKEGTDNE